MVRRTQKEQERVYVEALAKLLEKQWHLDPGHDERPDFLIIEGGHRFGLEVTSVFKGSLGERGSELKMAESDTQKVIDKLRRDYEGQQNVQLRVGMVGSIEDESLAELLTEMLDVGFIEKPFGHREVIEIDKGERRLRAHITRAYQSEWFNAGDRAGWVNTDPGAVLIYLGQHLQFLG